MATTTSVDGILVSASHSRLTRTLTSLEILLVYAGILLYIWQWQATVPRVWMVLWGMVLLSHLVHRDTPRTLGLTWKNLRGCAEVVFPLAAAAFFPIMIYGFARHRLALAVPQKSGMVSFGAYLLWCGFQQYLAQSYFHCRLMEIVRSPHLSSLILALMFGGAHIPNPILMPATAIAGYAFAAIFARHRNIWPLALAQAAGGILVAAVSPAAIIHNMRVGPGYFFYHVR